MNTVAPATSASSLATATARFILEKPLHELTEDDISQLTREDCRRYLKDKGMRRPSWNKSQAIQQVISLKSLLEPPPPVRSTTAPPPLPIVTFVSPPEIPTPRVTSNSSSSLKELSPAGGEAPESSPADDGASDPLDVSSGSEPLREDDSAPPTTDDSVRDTSVPDLPVRQMTIFYCGKVNVYDGVPPDKAENVMQLASSSAQVLHSDSNVVNSLQRETVGHFSGSGVRFNVFPPRTTLSQSVQCDVEGHTNRQVSLQRYREKREERGRFKIRKKMGPSSSVLDMYLNQQTRMQGANKQLSPGSMSPPVQPGQSRAHFSSMENQLKKPGFAVDLNYRA